MKGSKVWQSITKDEVHSSVMSVSPTLADPSLKKDSKQKFLNILFMVVIMLNPYLKLNGNALRKPLKLRGFIHSYITQTCA